MLVTEKLNIYSILQENDFMYVLSLFPFQV